jgi:hypothetical protein
MREFAFKIIATSDEEGLRGRREELIRIRAETVDTALDLAGYYALSAKCPDKDGWYFQCIEPARTSETAAFADSSYPTVGSVQGVSKSDIDRIAA